MKNCLDCKYSYIEDLDLDLCCKLDNENPCPRKVTTSINEYGDEVIKSIDYPACEKYEESYPTYKVGEAVIYQNGDRFELGIVKKVCGGDDYFVNYHTGNTAARTNARHLHKISNLYAFHVIRLDPDDKERR